jgi:hypothetical protein
MLRAGCGNAKRTIILTTVSAVNDIKCDDHQSHLIRDRAIPFDFSQNLRGRLNFGDRVAPARATQLSIQSKFSIANRWAMKSLIPCQNEASRGLSSASRPTALSSCSNKARSAAGFDAAGARNSLIRSSAVISLVASNSDDRARSRKASMHVSRRVLMTRLNDTYSARIYYICPEIFSHRICARCRAFVGPCRCAKVTASICAFSAPFPLTCRSGNRQVSFHF